MNPFSAENLAARYAPPRCDVERPVIQARPEGRLSDRYTSQSNFFEPFGLSFSVAGSSKDYLREVFLRDRSLIRTRLKTQLMPS
jgi:hypothetical protein